MSPSRGKGATGAIGGILILITTVFWGGGFVAQKLGADGLGPNAIIVFRSIVATLALMAVQLFRGKLGSVFSARTMINGAIGGVALFVPMYAQQKAFDFDISPGVCAFLTANYILLVPIFGMFVGRKSSLFDWLMLVPAMVGTYFICVTGDDVFSIGSGEMWTLLCAALFAVQILVVDRFAPAVDPISFTIVMFVVCAICGAPFLLTDGESAKLTAEGLKTALPAVIFLGLGSSGVGYTLQNVAQGIGTPPALASMIMSLESVCGAFFGWLFFSDVFTSRCLFGCALVFTAALCDELSHVLIPSRSDSK